MKRPTEIWQCSSGTRFTSPLECPFASEKRVCFWTDKPCDAVRGTVRWEDQHRQRKRAVPDPSAEKEAPNAHSS
jgi:hypothetical protein